MSDNEPADVTLRIFPWGQLEVMVGKDGIWMSANGIELNQRTEGVGGAFITAHITGTALKAIAEKTGRPIVRVAPDAVEKLCGLVEKLIAPTFITTKDPMGPQPGELIEVDGTVEEIRHVSQDELLMRAGKKTCPHCGFKA